MPEVRLACEEDIKDIYGLEEACFSDPFPVTVPYEDICVSNHPYMILKEKGKTLGYGGMYVVLDEAYLLNICVAPERQGEGLGKVLLQGMIKKAAQMGAQSMTLEVRVSNVVALELYKDFGFVIEALRPKYYEDTGEDAYIMWKKGL